MFKTLLRQVIIVILLCCCISLTAQQRMSPRNPCDSLFSAINKQWRADSLGKAGFRKANVQKFLGCAQMKIYPDYLVNSLGMFNETWSTELETVYVYYLSEKTLLNGRKWIEYVSFRVRSPENYTVKIEQGEIVR